MRLGKLLYKPKAEHDFNPVTLQATLLTATLTGVVVQAYNSSSSGKLRQENLKFKPIQENLVRPCLKIELLQWYSDPGFNL